jgi:glycerol-3-phosphate dehydrogenase
MLRDLHAMSTKQHDLLVVGGGVTGACVAWDAALRGLSVALVEKHDFGHATTAASSKLIHGGLRYLKNFELGIVRESLRERRTWSANAPHLVYPLPFLLPTRGMGLTNKTLLHAGLTLYDWLAYDRNRLDDPAQHIPAHCSLSAAEAIQLEPNLAATRLSGAILYHDCQMYSPDRLNLELLLGSVAHGAHVANYAEVAAFLREDDSNSRRKRITGCRVRDQLTGSEHELRGKIIVNASGPWADRMMAQLAGGPPPRRLLRSKGIHIVTRPLTRTHAVTLSAPGGGHFFIIPWRRHSLIGTTDTVFEGDPDAFGVTEQDIAEFLAIINAGFPAAKLSRDDVLFFYGGMRPLVDRQTRVNAGAATDDEAPDSYSVSRAAEVLDHEQGGGPLGAISAIGGKWTTSRHLAEQIVDLAMRKLGREAQPCSTASTPTHAGDVGRFAQFQAQARARHADLAPAIVDNLSRSYGSRMDEIISLIREEPSLAQPVCSHLFDIGAQIVHAVRVEMALTLEDVVFRRTGLGTLGSPGDPALQHVADLMARELGWDATERQSQIDQAAARFVPLSSPAVPAGV